MEEQHPIPQQISSYQFHLVGDMTLKQFFQVAGGALVSLLFYSSALNPLVKWPLVILSFLFGIAIAFFPIQDRPLTTWLFSFFKSIYSPTVFNWEQVDKKPQYYQPEAALPIQADVSAQNQTEAHNVPQVQPNVPAKPTEVVTPTPPTQIQNVASASAPTQAALQTPQVEDVPKTTAEQNIPIPESKQVEVPKQAENIDTPAETANQVYDAGSVVSPMTGTQFQNVQKATFTPEAAPPLPPTRPNIVVGQVMDTEGKILENAILEIRDSQGRSVRALRTNKLGHFMIVTPLMDGNYELSTEKDDYEFSPISFEAKNEIVPPIQITGKKIEVDENINTPEIKQNA